LVASIELAKNERPILGDLLSTNPWIPDFSSVRAICGHGFLNAMAKMFSVQEKKRAMCENVMQDKLTKEEYASLFGRVTHGKPSNLIMPWLQYSDKIIRRARKPSYWA